MLHFHCICSLSLVVSIQHSANVEKGIRSSLERSPLETDTLNQNITSFGYKNRTQITSLAISPVFLLLELFIMKAIIMNFSDDCDVYMLHLFTKFQPYRCSNNGDQLSDRKKKPGNIQTYTHTD